MGFAPLKAVFAVIFSLMCAVQPGFFATANATGFHSDAGMILSVEEPVQDVGTDAHSHHNEANASQSHSPLHDGGAKNAGDKSCEVHCAPAQAVPTEWPMFGHATARCFAIRPATVMQHGDYAELNRPPRHLS